MRSLGPSIEEVLDVARLLGISPIHQSFSGYSELIEECKRMSQGMLIDPPISWLQYSCFPAPCGEIPLDQEYNCNLGLAQT